MEIFKKLNYKSNELLVSNTGRIIREKDGKELNSRLNHDGYYVVTINENFTSWRSVSIHRLVAFAFVENDNPDVNIEVNHIDFNRTNNNPDNLEWTTHADNIKHSCLAGRYAKQTGELNHNYGNRKLSKIYKDNPALALEKQSRPGIMNGRCVQVTLYKDGIKIKDFPYIRACCEYIKENESPDAKIDSIAGRLAGQTKKGSSYKGYTYEKH